MDGGDLPLALEDGGLDELLATVDNPRIGHGIVEEAGHDGEVDPAPRWALRRLTHFFPLGGRENE